MIKAYLGLSINGGSQWMVYNGKSIIIHLKMDDLEAPLFQESTISLLPYSSNVARWQTFPAAESSTPKFVPGRFCSSTVKVKQS